MSHAHRLRQTEIFSKLSEDELEAVSRCVEERDAAAGEILIHEGKPGECLFIIQRGKVSVEKLQGERKVKLAELGEGNAFGEMSLIDNFPTSASVIATERCSFLVVSRLDLNVLLNWDTVLASKMWRSFTEMLCYRVRASNDRLLERFGDEASRELIHATDGIEAR
jgi:CRP/FNR family cyclic AMP-dependent transcriptional regulator